MIAIELLTGAHPIVARELIDDNEFAELPDAIQQQHDEGTPVASKSKCKWPQGPFSRVALIAAKCSRTQAKRRSTIEEVLPELEELVSPAAKGREDETPRFDEFSGEPLNDAARRVRRGQSAKRAK